MPPKEKLQVRKRRHTLPPSSFLGITCLVFTATLCSSLPLGLSCGSFGSESQGTIFFIMINKQKKGCGQSWKPCALLLRRWNTAAVKQYDVPKKVKIELPFMIQWLYSEHILPQTENRRDVCASMFIGVLDTITKMWKQPKYSTMDERISKVWYVHTGEYYSALRRKFWCMLQHGWKLRTLC